MPDDASRPDPEVPDYVPEEWVTRYRSVGWHIHLTRSDLRATALFGLVSFVCTGVVAVAVISLVWQTPSVWGRVAVVGLLAALSAACWLTERLLRTPRG